MAAECGAFGECFDGLANLLPCVSNEPALNDVVFSKDPNKKIVQPQVPNVSDMTQFQRETTYKLAKALAQAEILQAENAALKSELTNRSLKHEVTHVELTKSKDETAYMKAENYNLKQKMMKRDTGEEVKASPRRARSPVLYPPIQPVQPIPSIPSGALGNSFGAEYLQTNALNHFGSPQMHPSFPAMSHPYQPGLFGPGITNHAETFSRSMRDMASNSEISRSTRETSASA